MNQKWLSTLLLYQVARRRLQASGKLHRHCHPVRHWLEVRVAAIRFSLVLFLVWRLRRLGQTQDKPRAARVPIVADAHGSPMRDSLADILRGQGHDVRAFADPQPRPGILGREKRVEYAVERRRRNARSRIPHVYLSRARLKPTGVDKRPSAGARRLQTVDHQVE